MPWKTFSQLAVDKLIAKHKKLVCFVLISVQPIAVSFFFQPKGAQRSVAYLGERLLPKLPQSPGLKVFPAEVAVPFGEVE